MGNPFDKDWSKQQQPATPTAHADITVVFDRSASMFDMQQGVVDGFNDFVGGMAKTPGDSRWTLVQFDDPDSAKGASEPFPQVLFENRPETSVPFLCCGAPVCASGFLKGEYPPPPMLPLHGRESVFFQPRGGTALIDALHSTIERTQARTSGQQDHVKNIMVVITDGEENSSRQHTNADLRQLIAQTQAQGWQYIYLGANQDSFRVAGNYGVTNTNMAGYVGLAPGAETTNVMNYVPTCGGIRQAIASGMIGTAAIVSGSIGKGRLVQPNVVVNS